MRIRINTGRVSQLLEMLAVSVLLVVAGLPISQTLPSAVRVTLQLGSVGLFLLIRLLRRKLLLQNLAMLFLITFGVVYYFGAWNGLITLTQYGFNMCSFWIFTFYGIELLTVESAPYKKTLYFMTIIMTLTALTTIIGVIQYPLAVRYLGKTSGFLAAEERSMYLRHNIATWNHLYGIVLFAPCLLEIFLREKKIVFLACFIVCEVAVFLSQITYALIISMGIIFLMTFNRAKSVKGIIVRLALFFAFAFAVLNMNAILSYAIDRIMASGLTTLASKLSDLQVLLFARDVVGDAEARLLLYGNSLSQFTRHPIGGLFLAGVNGVDLLGHHSELFDLMGFFGIAGIVALVFFTRLYIRMIERGAKKKKFFYVSLAGMLLLAVFNPVLYGSITAVGGFLTAAAIERTYPIGERV